MAIYKVDKDGKREYLSLEEYRKTFWPFMDAKFLALSKKYSPIPDEIWNEMELEQRFLLSPEMSVEGMFNFLNQYFKRFEELLQNKKETGIS